jgi:hypothetical protein
MWGQSKIAIAVVVLAATTTFASAQQSRKAILLSCSGDPQQVLAVQSSPGSPAVTLRGPCADAISAIISTPLGDETKDWDIKVAYSDKKLTQFLLWEAVQKSGPFNFSVEISKLTPKTRQVVIEVLKNALREIGGLPAQHSPDPL